MRASIALAGVALLCATVAAADPAFGRTLYVASEPSFAGPRVFNRPVEVEDNLRARRDAPITPTTPAPLRSSSNISTWMNHLNDSHQQLMVHWVGEGSRVIVCLARDPAPRKLAPPVPSALYVSYDYGATFVNKTESFRISGAGTPPKYAQLDKFYNHPKYPQYCIFVDAANSMIFYTSDNGINIGQTVVSFVPSDLAFHQHFPERFLIHDKVDAMKTLYLTMDGGRTFETLQQNVKSFHWVWRDGVAEGVLYVERLEPRSTGDGELVTVSLDTRRPTPLLSAVRDFHIKGEFMFATQTYKDGVRLLISHARGPFYSAEFETSRPLLRFQVADVTESRVLIAAMHAENNSALYVSQINANFTQYKFRLSLDNIMAYFPNATWKDSWLEDVAEEAFTDVYRVEGVRGVYVASRVTMQPAPGNVGAEHLASIITFDHGGTWAPVTPPAEDENGVPINCRLENSCSLHLSQKFSQLYPVTRYDAYIGPRSASIMSSKSAPGIIMATGVLGKSMKGIPGVFLSRDAGVTWKRVLKDYYFFNSGDHGGVLVAVKYFKSRGETRRILYSTDEGRTWNSHQFHADDLRVYGLMTEPGENTTTFTMFGSAKEHHQWIIITVDLMNAFARNCTANDYKMWSPAPPNSTVFCVLGTRETFQRRHPHASCYNGLDYDKPVKKQACDCNRSDYECDYGFMLSGSDCVRNKSSRHDPYAVPEACRPGQFYRRTKGYRLIDGDVCIPAYYVPYAPDLVPCPMRETTEFLIVALKDKIARIDLETNETTFFAIQDVRNIVAIEFDLKNNCIYWADIERDIIGRQCLSNGTATQEYIVETDLASIEGMALDWISNVLFFVDGMRVKIEAVRTDLSNGGRMRRTILGAESLVKPRGIAVHPKAGYLFWTDWNSVNPSISRANLDGSNIKKLFGQPLVEWPNGITIDQIAERIYWVDAMADYIASADLNGQYFKKVLFSDSRVAHPFAVAVLKDRMYWDDWKAGAIFSADKDRGTDIITLHYNISLTGLMDLKVFAHFTQHGSNACAWKNSTCRAMCVGGPRGTSSCLCPDGLAGKDGRCLCPSGVEPYDNMTCPMKGNTCGPKEWRCANGLCVSESWRCDGDSDCGDGSDERGCGPACLAPMISCDRGRLCLPPYWACDREIDCHDGTDEAHCPKQNCTSKEFVCASGQCVDQKLRCDGDHDCKDGSDELDCPAAKWMRECYPGDFKCPNSTKCISASWLCDGETDCPGDGDESSELCAEVVCTDTMFRCAGNGKCIRKAWVCDHEDDCNDGLSSDEQNCTFTTERPHVTVSPPPHNTSTDHCDEWMFACRNGGCVSAWWKCDQINDCGDGSDELGCAYLDRDDASAENVPMNAKGTCDPHHFTCSPGVCVPMDWVCDTATDCPNGEDELDCHYQHRATGAPPPAPLICAPDDIPCADRSRCVLAAQLCDGTAQCADGSDESNCPHQHKKPATPCSPGQFSCDAGVRCIPRAAVCDAHQDCYDGTDELDCKAPAHSEKPGLGVDQRSIDSQGFLISCWLAQKQNVTYSFLPSVSLVGSGEWRNMTYIRDSVYQFKGLQPYTEYNVTFYIRDSLTNRTVHSGVYVNVTTAEGEPSPPQGVVARQMLGRAVEVQWAPPSHPNGHLVGYSVAYSPPEPPLYERVDAAKTTAYIVGDFKPRTNYTFKVMAINGKHESQFSEAVTLEFDSVGDVDELTNVSASRPNDTVVVLSWDKLRGVDGYIVSFEMPQGYPELRARNTTNNTIALTDLPPGTSLSIKVSPYKGKIVGRPFTIPMKTRGEPEETIQWTASASEDRREVALSWSPPRAERYRGRPLVYHVYYTPATHLETRNIFSEPQQVTSKTSALVTGLKVCSLYYMAVGLKGGPFGSPMQINAGFANETAVVRDLRASVDSEKATLHVTWVVTCVLTNQSVIYQLEVVELNRRDASSSRYQLASSTNETMSHTFNNIPAGARYSICVWVLYSLEPRKCTEARAQPVPTPDNVEAWLAPNGHLMVSWREPRDKNKADHRQTFEIVVHDREMAQLAGAAPAGATVLPAATSPHLAVLPAGVGRAGGELYVAVRTVSPDGYWSDLSEVQAVPTEGDTEAASAWSGGGGAWYWAAGAALAAVALGAALLHLALRHRRLAHSFLRFTSHQHAPPVSRYDSRRGQATIADHEEDETPNIQGFSDDEPLVIA